MSIPVGLLAESLRRLSVSRLAYTWGWDGNKENIAPGSSLIEINLLPNNGNTLPRFVHSGVGADDILGE